MALLIIAASYYSAPFGMILLAAGLAVEWRTEPCAFHLLHPNCQEERVSPSRNHPAGICGRRPALFRALYQCRTGILHPGAAGFLYDGDRGTVAEGGYASFRPVCDDTDGSACPDRFSPGIPRRGDNGLSWVYSHIGHFFKPELFLLYPRNRPAVLYRAVLPFMEKIQPPSI